MTGLAYNMALTGALHLDVVVCMPCEQTGSAMNYSCLVIVQNKQAESSMCLQSSCLTFTITDVHRSILYLPNSSRIHHLCARTVIQ